MACTCRTFVPEVMTKKSVKLATSRKSSTSVSSALRSPAAWTAARMRSSKSSALIAGFACAASSSRGAASPAPSGSVLFLDSGIGEFCSISLPVKSVLLYVLRDSGRDQRVQLTKLTAFDRGTHLCGRDLYVRRVTQEDSRLFRLLKLGLDLFARAPAHVNNPASNLFGNVRGRELVAGPRHDDCVCQRQDPLPLAPRRYLLPGVRAHYEEDPGRSTCALAEG